MVSHQLFPHGVHWTAAGDELWCPTSYGVGDGLRRSRSSYDTIVRVFFLPSEVGLPQLGRATTVEGEVPHGAMIFLRPVLLPSS